MNTSTIRSNLRELQRVATSGVRRRVLPSLAIVGVIASTATTWLVDRANTLPVFGFSAAVAVFVFAWFHRRRQTLLGISVLWWLMTAPMTAVVANYKASESFLYARYELSGTAIVLLGLAAWVVTVQLGYRNGWITVLTAWAGMFAGLVAAETLFPAYGLWGGIGGAVVVLAIGSEIPAGWLSRRWRKVTRRPDYAPSARAAVSDVDARLSQSLGDLDRRWSLWEASTTRTQPPADSDLLAIGPGGVHAVFLVRGRSNQVQQTAKGNLRLKGAPLAGVAAAARSAAEILSVVLKTPVTPLIIPSEADMPDGMSAVAIGESGRDTSGVLMMDAVTAGRYMSRKEALGTAYRRRAVRRARQHLRPQSPIRPADATEDVPSTAAEPQQA